MPCKVMLAVDADIDSIQFPCVAQPKIDGIRCHVEMTENGPVALTRANKPIPNRFIRSALSRKELVGFDGEITSGNTFQETTSAVMSFDGAPDFRFHVFDITNMDDTSYVERYSRLVDRSFVTLFDKNQVRVSPVFKHVRVVDSQLVPDRETLERIEEVWLKEGYEGVIVRAPQAPYKHGRSTKKQGYLLKIKRFSDAEAVVEGVEELMHNANELGTNELGYAQRSTKKEGLVGADTLGALLCKTDDGVEFKIGTGFDAATRKELWDRRSELTGKLVKYKYFATGVKEAPRFPVFLGFRDEADL